LSEEIQIVFVPDQQLPLKFGEPLLTTAQVAARLNFSPAFVRRHADDLNGIKIGGEFRFRETDIEAYLSTCRDNGTEAQ
jgi:excisionase family DNA binding protein